MWDHELALMVRSYEDKISLKMVTEVYYMNNKIKIIYKCEKPKFGYSTMCVPINTQIL